MERSRVKDIKKKFEVTQNTTESSIKNDVNKTESNQNNSINSEISKQEDLLHQNLRLSNSNCSNFVGRGNIKRSHAFRADKPISRKDFNNVGGDLLFNTDITNSFVNHDTGRLNSQLPSNKQLGYDSRQKRYSCKKKDNNFNNNSNTNSSTDLESNCNKDYLNYNFNSNVVTSVGSSIATPSTSKDFHQRSCNIISSNERDENQSVRDTYSTVLKSNKNNTKESPKNVILNNSSNSICSSIIISNENCDKSANKMIKSNKISETDVKSIIKSVEQRNLEKKNSEEKLKSHKLLRATQSNSSSSNIQVNECLSNTLKAALSAPLPTGPPPKKPPRTFAHNITSSTTNESPPKTDNELLKVQKTNSSIATTNLQPNDFPKPIRSKTESQIMLKKLENYLLNHHQQQNTSSNLNTKCSNSKISISSSSSNNKNLLKMDKQHTIVDTEGISQSNLSDIRNPRINSNMNSENVSICRQSSNNNNNNLCFNSLNCTKRPIYESPIYKKSNFFVTFPRQSNSITCDNETTDSTINELRRTSYGTIQRAVSDEHIYAEPETINEYSDFITGRNNNLKISSSKLKSATISDRCRKSSGDNYTPNSSKAILTAVNNNNNSKITTSNVKLMRANFEQDTTTTSDGGSLSWPSSPPPLPPTSSSSSNSMITQYGLHYMCTPINDSSHHNVNARHGDSLDSSLLSSATTTVAAVSSPIASDDFTPRIRDNKLINEAINASVKLSLIKTPATSIPYPSSPQSDLLESSIASNDHLLLSSVNNASDCRRPPRRNRHHFAAISCAPNDTTNTHQSTSIDKQKINQLLSEAYGKIRPSTGFADRNNRILSPGMSTLSQVGSTGTIVGDINRSGSPTDSDSSSPEPEDIHNQRTSNMNIEGAPIASTGSSVGNGNTGSIGKNSKDREQITAERKGYVRRVSRRLTSVRKYAQFGDDRFPHLFECLLLVGLDLNSARCKVPYIKTKFPEHTSSPTGIERLCFPDADDWPPSPNSGQSYTQVLTDSNGVRKYSYCRRVQPEDAIICLPLVYCIITSFKSNMFYNKILIDLESRHGLQSDVELKKFIQQLYDCPFPAPGQNLSIHQQINSSSTDRGGTTLDVYKRSLDSRQEDNELAQLLTTVKLSVFLQMFTTLLHERKVILVSDSISKLSVCIEGLQSALYPFHWQHTIVPILPSCLMDVCQAPTPYLIGIIKPKLSDIPFNNSDLDLVVDIDDGLILNSIGDEGWILPSRLSRGLRSALLLSIQAASQSSSQSQSSDLNTANILASEAIMRLFVELIGHYRDHIAVVSNDPKKREFQRDSFVRSGSSRSVQLFLEWFTETAMFNAFIESRVERSSESRGLFEQRCSEYIEEHGGINGGGLGGGVNTHAAGHTIMKNYKAINKTVKNLGDRFKDWASSTSSS